MSKVKLDKYDNSWYTAGSYFKILSWYVVNVFFFKTSLPFPSSFKKLLLELFGAKVGFGVVIKPNVSIKYPWFLEIGNNVWIGESVWIDNLANVRIGSNVCLSQGCYILTGNHNYKSETFDLLVSEIVIEDGVWIGARSVVCPGVICKENSVLSVNSVATSLLESNGVYQGNPAKWKRCRF